MSADVSPTDGQSSSVSPSGLLLALALLVVVLSVLVFTRRAVGAWTTAGIAPGVALTSGFEEESLFALYRAAHGTPVYADTTRLPFASAYFNWLFYSANGVPLRPLVARYGDEAIPRAARLLTAIASLAGLLTLLQFGRRVLPGNIRITLPIAVSIFLGPLVGWWAHTARPDVWALTCETAALVVLLGFVRTRPTWAVTSSLVLFYAAWAFKPTYIFGHGTAIVFLLFRRRYAATAILTFGSIALWIVTYAFMGPAYRTAMHDTAVTNIFDVSIGWQNFLNAVAKTAPLIIFTAGLALWRAGDHAGNKTDLAQDTRLLGGIGVGLSTLLCFIASCKMGAASNYFFTPILMVALLALGLAARRSAPSWIAIFLVLTSLTQTLVFFGKFGLIDLQPARTELAVRWSTWKDQPEPRFSSDARLNLPWLNPHSPPLVLAFNYSLDRAAGRKFEADGVGGLIASGFFAALLLPAGETSEYDGGNLRRYHRSTDVGGMTIYLRNEPVAIKP